MAHMDPEQILPRINALRNERSTAEAEIKRIDLAIRESVEAAFEAGVHHTEIVKASSLSQARVYQIRKGTRR